MKYHLPVLLHEACTSLSIQQGYVYVDATLGHGGHTIEILKQGGIVYGIDTDPESIKIARNRIKDEVPTHLKNFFYIHSNYSNLTKLIEQGQIPTNISGLIADLGINSYQLLNSPRGLSFGGADFLDMRLNQLQDTPTASDIVNTYTYDDLTNLLSKISQEKLAGPIASEIINRRKESPIRTSNELSKLVNNVYEKHHLRSTIHPATKTFMSLRIAVNQEYLHLKQLLDCTLALPRNSHISLISFHSGEDRIIKLFLNSHRHLININKPIRPSNQEVSTNPLSRSATLRSYTIN